MRQGQRSVLQLAADVWMPCTCACVAQGDCPRCQRGLHSKAPTVRCSALQMVLLVLVKLLAEPAVQDRAPAVLSQLLSGNVELQKAAADADAATKLAAFLCKEDCRAPLQASSLPHMLGRAGLQSSTHAAQGRFAVFHLTSLRWLSGLC